MTSTTTRGYPFPGDNDLVIQGDEAIQALAEAVDADVQQLLNIFQPAWCATYDNSNLAMGSGITLPTPITGGSGDFSQSAGVITYTGPSRLFMFTATVVIGTDTVGRQIVRLFHNANVAMTTNELGTTGEDRTHVITCLVNMVSGDGLHLDAYATSGDGVAESTQVSIVSVSPAGIV